MVFESIYWTNINDDIEKHIKNYCTCLDFQQTQPKEKIIHHIIPAKPWEIVGADTLTIHNRNYLCTVDYHNRFPVIKKIDDLSADSLLLTCKIIFSEYSLPWKIMSDSGGNFISDKFKTFCRSLIREQAFSSSYHHENNRQVEACIKLIKQTLKCFDTKSDPHISLLLIRSTPLRSGLPSPTTLLFNCLIRGIKPTINRPPIGGWTLWGIGQKTNKKC